MAINYETVTQLARNYANDVKAVMPVSKAMLFGSHAKGSATEQVILMSAFSWMILKANGA